jgi:hypothetical protein
VPLTFLTVLCRRLARQDPERNLCVRVETKTIPILLPFRIRPGWRPPVRPAVPPVSPSTTKPDTAAVAAPADGARREPAAAVVPQSSKKGAVEPLPSQSEPSWVKVARELSVPVALVDDGTMSKWEARQKARQERNAAQAAVSAGASATAAVKRKEAPGKNAPAKRRSSGAAAAPATPAEPGSGNKSSTPPQPSGKRRRETPTSPAKKRRSASTSAGRRQQASSAKKNRSPKRRPSPRRVLAKR